MRRMDESAATPLIVLVPGHWLGAWAWDDVVAELERTGHTVIAVTLPGLDPADPNHTTRTVDDQAAFLMEVIAGRQPVVLVAHSGANYPTSVLLDRDPSAVARIVYVDSGPVADDSAFATDVPADVPEVPLPPFDDLPASLDGLSEERLTTFRSRSVPEPAPVMRERVQISNDARRDVPATFIVSSFSADQIREMAAAGHPMMAEVATLRDVEFVDLPTGHWPMWSRPVELAQAIAEAATHI